MIGTALATLAMALVAMAPGIILCRGMRLGTALLVAMAAASLAISLMATALAGVILEVIAGTSLQAWALLPISLLLSSSALLATREKTWTAPRFEWPALIPAATFALFAAYTYSIAFTGLPDGGLRVHAWFNADWFKHLGHVHALADYGIPARDIFGSGRPLHYYWLIYILPGASASINGDVWTAMYVANLLFVSLLFLAFYGVIRAIGLTPIGAAATVLIATVAAAPIEPGIALLQQGAEGVLRNENAAPAEPPFASLIWYVPQHAFAMTLLLAWAITTIDKNAIRHPVARWVALVGLTTVLTISTLLGAVLLGVYGLAELRRRRLRAGPEIATVAMLAGLFVLVLGVVATGDTQSVLQSPAFANPPTELTDFQRAIHSLTFVVGKNGLPLALAVYLAVKWKPEDESERNSRDLAVLIITVALFVGLVVEFVLGTRLSWEIRLRTANLPVVSIAMIGGYFVTRGWREGGKAKLAAIAVPSALVVVAMPSLVLATSWFGLRNDRNATEIPGADRQVLAALRARSAPRDIVWQHPEKPYLSTLSGRDSWSVILAGRTNIATERATDYAAAYSDIVRADRYFAGEEVSVPASVDWIYLSRALHPKSYDALLARLERPGSGWSKRDCYPDACIFERDAAR